jgi:rhodanese-related sulfurtransferase
MSVTQIGAIDAFDILQKDKNSVLIDVRTLEEFEKMLRNLFGKESKEAKLFFICRTGGRSDFAARLTSELGYTKCFNITSGFEGDLDSSHQRGKMSGWKAENLPWKQS